MVRTQISFSEDQVAHLREVARRRGRSMAAVVRDAVDRVIEEDLQAQRIRTAVAAARQVTTSSGHHDISREHDAYLADDFR